MNMKNNKLNGDDENDINREEVCVETLSTHLANVAEAYPGGEGLTDEDIEKIGNANAEAEEDRYPPWPIQDEYEFRYRNKGG